MHIDADLEGDDVMTLGTSRSLPLPVDISWPVYCLEISASTSSSRSDRSSNGAKSMSCNHKVRKLENSPRLIPHPTFMWALMTQSTHMYMYMYAHVISISREK